MICYILLIVNTFFEKTKDNNKLFLPTSIACVDKGWHSLFLCVIALHIKNTSVSHLVVLTCSFITMNMIGFNPGKWDSWENLSKPFSISKETE